MVMMIMMMMMMMNMSTVPHDDEAGDVLLVFSPSAARRDINEESAEFRAQYLWDILCCAILYCTILYYTITILY